METLRPTIHQFIYLAGLAQVALAAGSLAIPQVLYWKAELAKVKPLIKQMFWTYAAYILIINLSFGLISIVDYRELSNGSGLALIITGFITIYWLSRVIIQFFYFDRSSFPAGPWSKFAEVILVTLFIFLSLIYGLAFYFNYQQHLV